MDFKVYEKEEVLQPEGSQSYYKPNIIDLIPVTDEEGNITSCETVESYSDIIEQAAALATIWQRGLDPVDTDVGVRWSEIILGEITITQLMEDIKEAVENVTSNVTVTFTTTKDSDGNSVLKYTLQAVA